MSLILVIGSNQGDRVGHLNRAINELSKKYQFIAKSGVYESDAVDYLNQPAFLNQALEFAIPADTPEITMEKILEIEKSLGRTRTIDKGPRAIDIDIVFWGTEKYKGHNVIIPHPAWQDRSFVVKPVSELPFFQILEKTFIIPLEFSNEANPL